MEVGAVKQAYNNEVILLKKKLNQAKIQVIHKLTRKAKTLAEKKVPEKLKVKFTKKAESAVKEVLIIKKIKARDVAKFIVTHKGQLNEYLNRPTVDQDKACARLLLHKALQDKYKVMRERFSNISIKDLLMSRQERRKLKMEARENQKNKKKGKNANEPVQAEGDWNVEDVDMKDSQLNTSIDDEESSADEHHGSADEYDVNDEEDKLESNGSDASEDEDKPKVLLKNNVTSEVVDDTNNESNESSDEIESDDESKKLNDIATPDHESDELDDGSKNINIGKIVKSPQLSNKKLIVNNSDIPEKTVKLKDNSKNNVEKKHKDKNKNLKNKILLKKFNKEKSEIIQENKVVDPFFITATGENYMSLAEPRAPDEVKEVHKQGNRKYRRAVMFGHAPKGRPRRDDFRTETSNSRFGKFNDNSRGSFNSNFKTNGFDKYGPQKEFVKSIDSSDRGNFKDRGSSNDNNIQDVKPEKLHPSWEAKKRQSGIKPFQGKKIVFDEA